MKPVCYILYFEKGNMTKTYIGHTADFEQRLKIHIYQLHKNIHHNKEMQNLYNDGWVLSDKYKLFPVRNKKIAHELEQKLIKEQIKDLDLLNIELGFDTFTRNPNKEEIRKKLTKILDDFRKSITEEEYRNLRSMPGISNPMYGKKHTEETRDKIRIKVNDFYANNESPNLGLKRSDITKQKISIIASKRIGELNPFYGKTHSKDTRRRIALTRLGIKPINVKPVIIGNVQYPSVTEAGRKLSLSTSVVLWRVNSKNIKFADWKWFKCPTTIESTLNSGSE